MKRSQHIHALSSPDNTCCGSGDLARERNEFSRESEPRAQKPSAQSVGMDCALLAWAADQNQLTPHLQGILLRMVRMMAPDGTLMIPQGAIALGVRLGETQTRAAIKALVEAGVLLRTRRGAVGKGRSCDVLTANRERQHDNRDVSAVSPDNRDGAAVSANRENSQNDDNRDTPAVSARDSRDTAPVSPVDNFAPPMNRHGRARGLDNPLTTEIGSSSETLESVGEGVSPPPIMRGGGTFREDWVLGDEDRKFAGDQGLQNGSVDVVFAMFGAHHLSKHTISANWRGEWRKWVLRQAHDPRFSNSLPNHEANAHDRHGTNHDAEPIVRRERISPLTAARRRRKAERDAQREPIDFGRVESQRIP